MSNIKVVCRFRPFVPKEQDQQKIVNFIDDQTLNVQQDEQQLSFSYDQVFQIDTSQQDVFKQVGQNLVEQVFQGFNATLLVYGQTASGKTYTMIGEDTDPGLVSRSISLIFKKIADSPEHMEYRIKVSVYEIYNERLKDLIDGNKELKVREDSLRGFHVQNLSHRWVSEEKEIMDILRVSAKNRSIGVTNMNEKSSRSHLIFELALTTTNTEDYSTLNGRMMMVDLAGSECAGKTGATGKTLQEASQINKSLSTLGLVIYNLSEKSSQHIPYRDSLLTKILRNGLGGNSMTSLILTCSPSIFNLSETISTLRFGIRAKAVKINPRVNKEVTVQELKFQIQRLEEQLQMRDQGQDMQNVMDELMQKKRRIEELEDQLQNKTDSVIELSNELEAKNDEIKKICEQMNEIQSQLIEQQMIYQQQKQELDQRRKDIETYTINAKKDQDLLDKLQNQLLTTQQFQSDSLKIDMLNLKVDKLQELNKNLRFQIKTLEDQNKQQSENKMNDLKAFVSYNQGPKIFEVEQLKHQLQQKEQEVNSLQLVFKDRAIKVALLEEKLDEVQDYQKSLENMLKNKDYNMYEDLMVQRRKFEEISILYTKAQSVQQQFLAQQQVSQKKLEQKQIRLQKVELQNLELKQKIKELEIHLNKKYLEPPQKSTPQIEKVVIKKSQQQQLIDLL